MTEHEWLHGNLPGPVLDALVQRFRLDQTALGRRKLRLLGCAVCREVGDALHQGMLEHPLVIAERYAEGQVTEDHRLDAFGMVSAGPLPPEGPVQFRAQQAIAAVCAAQVELREVILHVSLARVGEANWPGPTFARIRELRQEVFGNPFRAMPWRYSADVLALARACDEGDAGAWTILADALEDLGAADDAAHCRRPGHVRGCYIIDRVLGRCPFA